MAEMISEVVSQAGNKAGKSILIKDIFKDIYLIASFTKAYNIEYTKKRQNNENTDKIIKQI